MLASLAICCLALPNQGELLVVAGRWRLDHAAAESSEVRLEAAEEGIRPSASIELTSFPKDRKLTLDVWLKADDDGHWVSIDTKATKLQRGERIPAQIRINPADGYVTTEYAKASTGWKRFRKYVTVSRSATTLSIRVSNLGSSPLLLSKPSLTAGEPQLCDLDGAGVLRGSIKVWVNPASGHSTGVVSFPIPQRYRDQAPLGLRLWSEPKGAIRNFAFRKRADGQIWLCDVEVAPGRGPALVGWESLVFVRATPAPNLPKAVEPDAPGAVRDWTRATACVQSGATLIKEKAAALASGNPDIETYARRVAKFTCDNRGGSEAWTRLDALTALACAGGGTCTNRANLAAALLRARGIPARTVAHLPTWCLGEALFTHWLVEYWHPKAGWTPIESTWGEFQPPWYTVIVLAISSADDEDLADDALQTRWVLPGAPMWSMAHLGDDLVPAPDKNQQENWARPERRLAGSAHELGALFQAACGSYESLLKSKKFADEGRFARIERALATAKATLLSKAIAPDGR